jgi:hypothetical protein
MDKMDLIHECLAKKQNHRDSHSSRDFDLDELEDLERKPLLSDTD